MPKIIGGFDKIIVFVKANRFDHYAFLNAKFKFDVSKRLKRRFDTSNLATSVLNFTSYPFEIFTHLQPLKRVRVEFGECSVKTANSAGNTTTLFVFETKENQLLLNVYSELTLS